MIGRPLFLLFMPPRRFAFEISEPRSCCVAFVMALWGMVLTSATWIPGLRCIIYFCDAEGNQALLVFIDIPVECRSARNDDYRSDRL